MPKYMQRISTVVIGGGASGIIAAISSRRRDREVIICERMPCLGRKILATGGGKCNLSNEDLKESHYNPDARQFVKSIFERFGKQHINNFFSGLGLRLYSEGGRIFPITNQSSSVLKVLEEELKRLSIAVEFNFDVRDILETGKGFVAKSREGKAITCDSIIIAGGGRTYPSLGSNGGCYGLASKLGHHIIEPVPSTVPLAAKDKFCHLLQGQRISCAAKSIIDGKIKKEAEGEILFTKHGLSGTAILDISEDVSIAINRHNKKHIVVSIDLVPFMTLDELKEEIQARLARGFKKEDLMLGILPNKFSIVFRELFKDMGVDKIADILKDKRFDIIGTRGWNEAEFTRGGVDINEVKQGTLESRLKKGIYFAGEVLDVDGERGGYNLAWAWASGFVAGLMRT